MARAGPASGDGGETAAFANVDQAFPRMSVLAFSPIMIEAAFVLELTTRGMIELSQIRSPSTPRTFNCGSTTEFASPPIRHVPTG